MKDDVCLKSPVVAIAKALNTAGYEIRGFRTAVDPINPKGELIILEIAKQTEGEKK